MKKNFKVAKNEEGSRLDHWLKRKFFYLPQSFIEKNIRKGKIKVNDKKIKAGSKVIYGDLVNLYDYEKEKFYNVKKQKKNLRIDKKILNKFYNSVVFENSDFIILNKWHGISSQGGYKISVSIDHIIKYISDNYNLVHRLDKETSGLMIIAKNLPTTKIIGNLFKEKKIKKIYIALCHGRPKINDKFIEFNKENTFDYPEGKTLHKLIDLKNNFSLNFFRPLTGKKHQLRTLSKKLNCPIVGDLKYNFKNKLIPEKLKLNAHILNFTIDSKKFEFKSNLSPDLIDFLRQYKFKINLKKISDEF